MRQAGVRSDILLAAERLILGSGIQAATTRAIAKAAGCAEGSIYRHFPGKNALVLEVVGSCFSEFAEALDDLSRRAGQGSVLHNLRGVAIRALGFYRAVLPVTSGVLSDPVLLKEHRTSFKPGDAGPAKALADVSDYLQREQSLGRVASGVAAVDCARMLLGTLFAQAFMEELTGERRDDGAVVEGVLATLWAALRPVDEMIATSA